jgi:tetratricopeptide (TPR) repeat protein
MMGVGRESPAPAALPPPPPPGALRLASALSVATRIEPELVRAMRLALFPDLDVGVESDLWFSEWVGLRNPGSVVFLPQVLPVLRAGLRQMLDAHPTPAILAESLWTVISRAHQDLSPALFLEERVTWLAVTGSAGTEVDDELRQALVALVAEGRAGIAGWLADAWLRFPPEVLATTTAWQLGTVAARYADFGPPPMAVGSVGVADIAAMAPAIDDIPLPLLRERSAVIFGALSGPRVAAVLVPDTDPVIIDVKSGESDWRTVQVPRGQVVRVDFADPAPVTVRTARGVQYELGARQPDPPDAPSVDPKPGGAREQFPGGAGLTPLGWTPTPGPAEPGALDAAITRLSARLAPSADDLRGLARARLDRFLLDGDIADLNDAISAYRQAAELTETLSADLLAELAEALHDRFLVTGTMRDLQEAGELARRAVDVPGPSAPNVLLLLALILFSEFQTTGSPGLLDEAIQLAGDASRDTPVDDPAYPFAVARIAELLIARFGISGAPDEIERAVELLSTAISLVPAGNLELGAMLNSLANSLLIIYRLRGDGENLRRSIELFRQSAEASPAPQRPMILAGLATALRALFELTGELAAIDEAVAAARAGAAAIPTGRASRPTVLEALSNALLARLTVTGAIGDLNEAVDAARLAVAAMTVADPGRPGALANLAGMLNLLAVRIDQSAYLDEAVRLAREAVETCPERSPYRLACLTVLADTLYTRYQRTGDSSALEEAIVALRHAEGGLSVGSPGRPAVRNRLADLLLAMFQRTRLTDYLDEGVTWARGAVATATPGTPTHARALSSLASLLSQQYAHQSRLESGAEAIELWKAAAQTVSAPTRVRLEAAVSWADLAVSWGEWPSALSGYEAALELLPLATWRGSTPAERATFLGRYARLGQDAAACALQVGQPERALELLDQGRGLFWEQAVESRTELTGLREVAPALAERLYALRGRLDVTEQDPLAPQVTERLSTQAADERYALAAEWEQLVASVRTIVGFEDFLRPLPFDALLSAAQDGPVVAINVSRIRCDALILTSRGLSVTRLRTHFAAIEAQAAKYVRIGREIDNTRMSPEVQMLETLAWLWDVIVGPVLAALGLRPVQREETFTRLWWCPTGPLTELPLHAAGHSDGSVRLDDNAMDYVASSYTPTLRALIEARAVPVRGAGDSELLIVESQSPPGRPEVRLPFADEEVTGIQRLLEASASASPGRVLGGPAATRDALLAWLGRTQVLHFIGHAVQTPDPAQSGLFLSDGILTIADISALHFPAGALAFLSACDSALTDNLLPDVVTLADAFHACGFRNVIAALSVVSDNAAAEVGIDFYRRLLVPSGYLRTENSGQALHGALRALRKRHPRVPWFYAAFIHIGP